MGRAWPMTEEWRKMGRTRPMTEECRKVTCPDQSQQRLGMQGEASLAFGLEALSHTEHIHLIPALVIARNMSFRGIYHNL